MSSKAPHVSLLMSALIAKNGPVTYLTYFTYIINNYTTTIEVYCDTRYDSVIKPQLELRSEEVILVCENGVPC